ncbi:MAG: Holliday junction branch migration protein RuvA [Bacillota bacterium]
MISYLNGKLIKKDLEYIVINVQGVGYKVYTPGTVQTSLPRRGKEVELHIYTYVREDAIKLYGFAALEELELFEKLLGVSKIGPKSALSALSTMSVRNFKQALVNGEEKTLQQIKGVGKKTAKRLILELQEKVEVDKIVDKDSNIDDSKMQDAIQGLMSLGYQKSQARKAVEKVVKEKPDLEVEDIIREGLSVI